MPIEGIVHTARSLSYYMRLQEVTANNAANANTDAFKADRLTANILPGMDHAVPVQRMDLRQGSFHETGRPLDLSLDGPGFLVVDTPRGERLTRGGTMRLDADGRLTDAHGDPLLGEGGPLVLYGTEIEVRGDGTVLVDGATAGVLRMVSVEEPLRLKKEGLGRFVAEGNVERAVEGTVFLRQGALEEPNADPLLAMVDLVTIQRAFTANLDALRAMDGVLGTIVNEVGKA